VVEQAAVMQKDTGSRLRRCRRLTHELIKHDDMYARGKTSRGTRKVSFRRLIL
jgi:hypothetical protein